MTSGISTTGSRVPGNRTGWLVWQPSEPGRHAHDQTWEKQTMKRTTVALAITLALVAGVAIPAGAQEVLPFPPKPSGSIAGRTMQESVYSPRPPVSHLPKDAPNILIVLIDDVGPAQTDTFGGEIHTPTLSKIAKEGIA